VGENDNSTNGGISEIAAKIAKRVGDRAGVSSVFGVPVERGSTTVVPVARVRWGFGGGGGQGPAGEPGEGAGGGGGVTVSPAGYIEIEDGSVVYRRIDPPVSPAMLFAAAFAFYLAMRGIRTLWR
jgi:uncharacterized spore protein YtfJ